MHEIFDVESESGIRINLSCQDFEIFEVMCTKNGVFRYFWGYVTFWFFSQMSSFTTTLSLQNELLNSEERFFFTKIRPHQVLTFIRTTLWAFTLKVFFEHIISNISKSWRDRLILISDSNSASKITPEMIFRFPTNTKPLFADILR